MDSLDILHGDLELAKIFETYQQIEKVYEGSLAAMGLRLIPKFSVGNTAQNISLTTRISTSE